MSDMEMAEVWRAVNHSDFCSEEPPDHIVLTMDDYGRHAYYKRAKSCEFTLEYDRDEVERRRIAHEAEPFGLFPQDMPETAWTCSECGQQYKVHYRDTESGPEPVPFTHWANYCPKCGSRIKCGDFDVEVDE